MATRSSAILSVETTVRTAEQAKKIVTQVLDARLAACVHVVTIDSRYRWKGKMRAHSEQLLNFKTSTRRLRPLMVTLRALHPDEVPYIASRRMEGAPASYLEWVASETKPTRTR